MEARTVVRGKRLKLGKVTLGSGEFMPEHATTEREEIIVCIFGRIEVKTPEGVTELGLDQYCYIPPETPHSVVNNTSDMAQYFYTVANLQEVSR